MTKLSLPIKGDYARWGPAEAVREFLQNGQDAHTDGFALSVSYDDETETMIVFNDGATISRDSGLVLGSTTKRDDSTKIGFWGEGGKLAAGTLIDLGMQVKIHNGLGEVWDFRIEHNEDFGTEMLHVHITDTGTCDGVRVEVVGMDKDTYDLSVGRCRWLLNNPDEDVYASSPAGSMLKGEDNAGQLFVQGIWVCVLPDGPWTFGYDLNDLRLDRDRRIADPWSLTRRIRGVINAATAEGALSSDELWEMFRGESAEAKAFSGRYVDAGDAHESVRAAFFEEHGKDARPVATPAELEKARQCGLNPVVVSPAQKAVLEALLGNLDDALTERSFCVDTYFDDDDLRENELKNLKWATYLVEIAEPWVGGCVRVVSFIGDNINARFCRDDCGDISIQLSRGILRRKSKLVAALVHEAAHKYGDDGTASHRTAEERIFGTIIAESIG